MARRHEPAELRIYGSHVFFVTIGKDDAGKQHKSALARQVYGLEYAIEAAWYWHGDVGPRDQPHKLYNETDDFGL